MSSWWRRRRCRHKDPRLQWLATPRHHRHEHDQSGSDPKIIPEMTYNVSNGTLSPTILYYTVRYSWVYSNRQSEGSVVLYRYRFMSSVSPVKSTDVHVHGCRTWVICCNYISVTFMLFMSSVSPVKSADVHVHGCRTWVICCNYISVTFVIFLYVFVFSHVILCYTFNQNSAKFPHCLKFIVFSQVMLFILYVFVYHLFILFIFIFIIIIMDI